jgi:predicted NBD/HSP70 family sugar kinase
LLRRMNERRILETIQMAGEMSRADLVRKVGISPPTVSKLVRTLLQMRVLEESDATAVAPGRPAKVLRLARKGKRIVAAVLDIKECSITITGLDGEIQPDRVVRFPTPASYKQLLEKLTRGIGKLAGHGKDNIAALGISLPGLIDRRRQQVLLSANLHLLDGQCPGKDLHAKTGIPVILLNETDALCLAERAYGQARGLEDFALVDAAGGLGASVVSGGELLNGNNGLAGEIGHITVDVRGKTCGCGNVGCLETVGCDSALLAIISKKIGHAVDMDEVIRLAQSGKLNISAEVEQTLEYLAIAIAAVVNIFNPSVVFVQARMLEIREGMFQRVLDLVKRRALGPSLAECRILQASGSKLKSAVAGTIHHLTTVLGPKV